MNEWKSRLCLSIMVSLSVRQCYAQFGIPRFAKGNGLRLSPFAITPANNIVQEGYVEIQYKRTWFRVCREGWGSAESYVACGNLGFSESVTPSQQNSRGLRDPNVRFLGIFCFGTEARLSECMMYVSSNEYCRSGLPATLSCRAMPVKGIRLRGGAIPGEGRVQVAFNSLYGGICSNGWNLKSASVACRQLGFGTAKQFYTGTEFGQGHGTVWFDNVRCSGREKSISDCRRDIAEQVNPFDHTHHGCSSKNLASVSCFTPYSAYKQQINLLDGSDRTAGRVVVNLGGRWGSICSDNWGMNEAIVACRQLGLGYASTAMKDVYHMTSSGRYLEITVTNLRCTGSENTLSDCKYSINRRRGVINCGTQYRSRRAYVGVACTKSLPDLQLNTLELQRSVSLDKQTLDILKCAAEERCLAPSAYAIQDKSHRRSLLRLTVSAWNRGTADFLPWQVPEQWEWHQCHSHYHSMAEFAHYDILSPTSFERVAEGHKVSFCLSDTECETGKNASFVCEDKPSRKTQGISVGCSDIYYDSYDCQWIDITDVPTGEYILRITLNPRRLVPELDYDNNEVICRITYNGTAAWANSCGVAKDTV